MAPKAKPEADLVKLKRAMKQRVEESRSGGSDIASAKDAFQTPEAGGLRGLLKEHSINADSLDTFGADLLEELIEL